MTITIDQLDQLERYYTPVREQRCCVCGAPLQFSASIGGGVSRYNCSSDTASPLKVGIGEPGKHEQMRHYLDSAWLDRGQSNLDVVLLVQAYRALVTEPTAITAELLSLRSEVEGILGLGAVLGSPVIEAIDKRIARNIGG